MQQLKDYSAQITKALEEILPKHIKCVIVLGDPKTSEVSTTSNMGDAGTASLIEDGLEVLRKPDEVDELGGSEDNSKLN